MPAVSPTPGAGTDDEATDHDDSGVRMADGGLVSVYETTENGVECTVFPAGADDAEVVTNWLTADAELVCDLTEWR